MTSNQRHYGKARHGMAGQGTARQGKGPSGRNTKEQYNERARMAYRF
jgi:hypothetical protein